MSHIEIETDILNIQLNKAHQNLKTLESIVNDKFSTPRKPTMLFFDPDEKLKISSKFEGI